VKEAFRNWVELLDPAIRKADHENGAWAGLGAAALTLVLAASRLPGAREVFQLPLGTALACLLPTLLAGPAINLYDRRRGWSQDGYGAVVITSAALLQFFASSLVALSATPGAFVMAALPILVAAYQGFVFLATPRMPFVAAGHGAGIAAALALRPDATHLALFAVIGPTALSGCLLLGSLAQKNARERARLASHRSAIQAQLLEQRSSELHRLSGALFEILERNHDASNALSSSLLNADLLVELTKRGAQADAEDDELHDVAGGMREDLLRLKRAVDDARQLVQDRGELRGESLLPVDVMSAARAAARSVGRRFPRVSISCSPDAVGDGGPRAAIRGGEETLLRVLENLLLNACQGDGTRGAARVALVVSDDERIGALAIQVADDGPGFAEELLGRSIAPFATTKSNGTGLGLYTVERLVRASGGTLRCENRASGGALVTAFLQQVAGR
jgi:signal transduction histidine kinase